jgi:hypothetical protein
VLSGRVPGVFHVGSGSLEADLGAIYNLCLILKSCRKYNWNLTLFVTAFTYIQMYVS